MRRLGKIGVYGSKTRAMQRRLSFEAFGLTFKMINVFLYLGDRSKSNPDIDDIKTRIFMEVPDRAYEGYSIPIPVGMEPMPEHKTDFSQFGIINPLGDETTFRVHIDDFEALGREIIVGDVFELPFYSDQKSKSFWEVTDVDLRSAPEKFIALITAVPLGESRKSREIPIDTNFGDNMEEFMEEFDIEVSQDVPQKGVTIDEEPEVEEVDYRHKEEADFLDDILKEL